MNPGLDTPNVPLTASPLGLGSLPARQAMPAVQDLRAQQYARGTNIEDAGARVDGTPKGRGFFGPLKTANGNVATEISIGMNVNGKEVLMPALVPTLTRQEVMHLLKGGRVTPDIEQKAVDHAMGRIKQGLSPFALPDEQPLAMPR